MKTLLLKTGLPGVLLGIAVSLAGCHRSGGAATETAASPTAIQAGIAGQRKPQGGGAVPDYVDTPAPPGVKTGVEEKR